MLSPLAQRMERLWISLLMMVDSSSALRRSLLPPNGSSIEADWSRRKMKHPGFFRLISALYVLAPRFRLLAFLDLFGRDVDLPHSPLFQDAVVLLLGDGGLLRCFRGGRSERNAFDAGDLSDVRPGPAAHRQRDEQDPDVEQLERAAEVRASARRARRRGSPLGKPAQTASLAAQEFRHGGESARA